MRKLNFVVSICLFLVLVACENEAEIPEEVQIKALLQEICPQDDIVQDKALAISMIQGKWEWIGTNHIGRGFTPWFETPQPGSNTMVKFFTADRIYIYRNGELIYENQYRIQYWGEGTNTVDNVLKLSYFDPISGNFIPGPPILLNSSNTCLSIIGSYNDAFGDSYYRRIEESTP